MYHIIFLFHTLSFSTDSIGTIFVSGGARPAGQQVPAQTDGANAAKRHREKEGEKYGSPQRNQHRGSKSRITLYLNVIELCSERLTTCMY